MAGRDSIEVSTEILINDSTKADELLTQFAKSLKPSYSRHNQQCYFVGLELFKTYNNMPRSGRVTGKAAVLALCNSGRCIIFQLPKLGMIPTTLAAFMEDPTVVFCSVGVKSCLDSLCRGFGLFCRSALDLERFPCGCDCCELGGGFHGGRSMLLGDWGAHCLTEEQVEYAAYCAYMYWHKADVEHTQGSDCC